MGGFYSTRMASPYDAPGPPSYVVSVAEAPKDDAPMMPPQHDAAPMMPPQQQEVPVPPQQAMAPYETESAGSATSDRHSLVGRVSGVFQAKKAIIDEKLLGIDNSRIRLISQLVNSVIGLMISLNAVLELGDTDCVIQFFWLVLFGLLFIVTSLKQSSIDKF